MIFKVTFDPIPTWPFFLNWTSLPSAKLVTAKDSYPTHEQHHQPNSNRGKANDRELHCSASLTGKIPRLQRQRGVPVRIADPVDLERRQGVLVLALEGEALELVLCTGAIEVGAQISLVAQLTALIAVEKGQERWGHGRCAQYEVAGRSGELGRFPGDFEFGHSWRVAIDAEGEVVDVPWDCAGWGAGCGDG